MSWRIGSVGEPGSPATVLELGGGELLPLDDLLRASGEQPPADTRVLTLLEAWETWEPRLHALAAAGLPAGCRPLDRAALTWLPPVCLPRKVVVCGTNYREHVLEMGGDPDQIAEPFTVLKPASTSPLGAGRPIVLPQQAQWVDWEGELGVVIGRRARHVDVGDALSAVAGYCPVNDVSARDRVHSPRPEVGMDWTFHKGFDGFTPAGPLITPARFVPDPQRLTIELTVNGAVKQRASTSEMIFGVAQLVAYLSSTMTLEPGDLLLTGSPSGSGFARSPRERLEPGDEVRVAIERLGELVNPVVAEEAA